MSVVGGAKSAWSSLSGRDSGGHNLQIQGTTRQLTLHVTHMSHSSLPCCSDAVDGNILRGEQELLQASRQGRVRGKLLHLRPVIDVACNMSSILTIESTQVLRFLTFDL